MIRNQKFEYRIRYVMIILDLHRRFIYDIIWTDIKNKNISGDIKFFRKENHEKIFFRKFYVFWFFLMFIIESYGQLFRLLLIKLFLSFSRPTLHSYLKSITWNNFSWCRIKIGIDFDRVCNSLVWRNGYPSSLDKRKKRLWMKWNRGWKSCALKY